MNIYSESEFRRRFRLSKDSVRYLYDLIGAELDPLKSRDGFTISGLDKILLTSRYYATASFHIATADFYGVSESSACNIVPIVSDKIAALRAQFIQMPVVDDEIEQNKCDFFSVAGMPGIIGAVDGTLVKIQEVGEFKVSLE
ncbi:putative nuclease HARBI1, partial [Sitodiplosis mosellana]|uniref:putative nuclease HARBI1 n=1 Tax=Sitodiplosis mosellana TaxID=263140 RepID=UPI0024439995